MKSSNVIVITALAGVLTTACARQVDSTVSTTTVTSGTGPRVTNTRPGDTEVAMRLADEMCKREAACNRVRADGDGLYRSDEACLADHGSRTPATVSRWECSPAETAATFEQCLAAIRSETCESKLVRAESLRACRSASICGR